MLDLAKYDLASDAERGATIHLKDPRNGEPLYAEGEPITISVKGVDGPTYRKAQNEAQRAMAAVGTIDAVYRSELLDEHASTVLAKVTTGWSNIAVDGTEWECTPEAAEALYGRFAWIKAQVDAAVANRGLFKPVE